MNAAIAGRIGPNAITRVAEALGPVRAPPVFRHAGLAAYLQSPPQAMVDEREVIALHAALRADLGDAEARRVADDAGRRTAAYLLAHRIPAAAQRLLKVLPAGMAARALLRAIGGHAWTFAGSGRFLARFTGDRARPVVLTIAHNPLCRGVHSAEPACDYYRAVFEWLFRALVHPGARVVEAACEACGDPACVFEVRW
ncbi:bacteriochlorophyll 4-vinyl reductase [Rubrivivax albus]|uniref:Bacteriochlorophyll 4-vinyl reductase n=1 Tax=Rubrivivax albus TaxID=2499835 RepID=A0A3S2TN94_9BURK|nr:bacteriochlorophyll 4-vinyl reductase [Rubrivivax albus]RVT52573.1 bacteriochlorophyll 4-vinyl reductase [Rubrivivax albus]